MAVPLRIGNCSDCTKKSSCFRQLSVKELDAINEGRVEVSYHAGEMIYKQGALASNIHYLKKGMVKLYIEGKQKNLILSIVSEGNLIGLPSLAGIPMCHYSAVALEETVTCLIDLNTFKRFTKSNAPFAAEVINLMSQSTVDYFDRFYTITQKNVPGRFADALIYLSDKIYCSSEFVSGISRKDLAELAVMSVESLSRVIKDFNEDNIVRIEGRSVRILNRELLERISENG